MSDGTSDRLSQPNAASSPGRLALRVRAEPARARVARSPRLPLSLASKSLYASSSVPGRVVTCREPSDVREASVTTASSPSEACADGSATSADPTCGAVVPRLSSTVCDPDGLPLTFSTCEPESWSADGRSRDCVTLAYEPVSRAACPRRTRTVTDGPGAARTLTRRPRTRTRTLIGFKLSL